MSWLKVQQSLINHPKIKRLGRTLGITRPHAVGLVVSLWSWALDYQEDGILTTWPCDDLADAAGWEGESSDFVDALVRAGGEGREGFLDRDAEGLRIHDWKDKDHAGQFMEDRERFREANRERQKRHRERVRNAPVTRDTSVSNAPVTQSNGPRVEKSREEETRGGSAEPPTPSEYAAAPRAARKSSRLEGAKAKTTGPKVTPKSTRVIDLIQAAVPSVPLAFTPRDGSAVKTCSAAPETIAAAYVAAARGEWGDNWMRGSNLNIRTVVERLASYELAGTTAKPKAANAFAFMEK